MKLTADSLAAHLAGALLPVYVVSGDEPLLVQEALDALRAGARQRGFGERQAWNMDRGGGASWNEVLANSRELSLFSSRRVVEIRLSSGKPGPGAAALLELIEATGEELLLIVSTGRLDRAAQSADWLQRAERRGALLALWPVDAARFPDWLRRRFRAAGLQADGAALELLAARTEGNLLAARQEIEKLALQLPAGSRVGARDVEAAAGESARYSTFQLVDALLAGDLRRSLLMIGGLRAEGTEPPLVQWALLRATHGLQARGSGPARRVSYPRLVQRAVRADRMGKGQLRGEVWDEFRLWAAELCGQRPLPLGAALLRSA